MNPELVSQIASAIGVAWGAYSAIKASRAHTRTVLLSNLFVALAMLLLVRLIADYGGWTSWFIYVWLLCLGAYVFGVYLAARAWSNLPWTTNGAAAKRSEMTGLGVSAVMTLAVAGALVIPGLVLG
ncbi:hypothetical protein [Brevibacterium zhoupengii]|uniref:hypothetical protein n=1 Tax=Brevibacterium zhoupengii TaxID=2898795 RepID=UPI001F0927FC|nr:hypothetical protein [Brevibacterium zhoupengii]